MTTSIRLVFRKQVYKCWEIIVLSKDYGRPLCRYPSFNAKKVRDWLHDSSYYWFQAFPSQQSLRNRRLCCKWIEFYYRASIGFWIVNCSILFIRSCLQLEVLVAPSLVTSTRRRRSMLMTMYQYLNAHLLLLPLLLVLLVLLVVLASY